VSSQARVTLTKLYSCCRHLFQTRLSLISTARVFALTHRLIPHLKQQE